jgi:hypothetical protein
VGDGLDPREAISFRAQERCGTVFVAAVPEDQGREEHLLEGFPIVASRVVTRLFPQEAIPNRPRCFAVSKHQGRYLIHQEY